MPASAGAAEWADVVEALLSDGSRLAELSAAATANAARPELSFEHNIDRFIALAESHASAGTRAAACRDAITGRPRPELASVSVPGWPRRCGRRRARPVKPQRPSETSLLRLFARASHKPCSTS